MVARHSAIRNANIRRAAPAYPRNLPIRKRDDVKLAGHRFQDHTRPLNGGHLDELPPLVANLYVRGEWRLAQLGGRWLVQVRTISSLRLAETALRPLLEATNVDALNGAFTPTRCNERVIVVRTLSEANAASFGLAANLGALGSKTGIPHLLGSNNCGVRGQLTDTEFGTPDFNEIPLRKRVESHWEAPHSEPSLLWIGGGPLDLR